MNYLITQYPVTHDYLERISEKISEPIESVVVSTITARGYLSIFKFFRSLKSNAIFISVIDSSAQPLLPPLQILSMLVRARQRYIVDPDFSLRPFGLSTALLGGLRMVASTVDGVLTVVRNWLRLGRLLNSPRKPAPDIGTSRTLYLKTNLWLGVQAGGSVAHTSGVVKGLLERGGEIEFFSAEAPIALPENDALKINPVRPQSTYIIPREFNHYRHNGRFINAVSSGFGGGKGFIYQRLSLGNYAGVVLSRRYNLPLVIEYNGSEAWLANNWGAPLALEKLAMRAENTCLRHAHLVVTVSDVLKDELVGRGVEPERIVSYPNGVDTDQFSPDRFTEKEVATLRARYGISKDSIVVTFVGTFGPWHGAEVFAQSVAKITAENLTWLKTRKLHFMFIGDGIRRRIVEDMTAGEDIRRFVTITGLIDQEETPLHLTASDILVSPHVRNPDGSLFFGSPTKLFEYLASGRPVVGSDLGQIGEVLEGCPHVGELGGNPEKSAPDGAGGILVQPEEAGELTAAILFLAENTDWRQAAGRNARRLVLDRYTWNHHVGAILEGLKRAEALDAVAVKPRVRLLFNGLHSKSGGGLTYLDNILPLMAGDNGIDLHLCVHEDQMESLPENLDGVTVHTLDFAQGFWRLQIREQIDIPRLAKRIGADVTFSPANYGPLLAPNLVVLLRNALSVAFVERRLVKLGYWALVYLGTFLSLLVSRKAITVSEYAKNAASGGLIGLFGNRFTVVPHGVSEVFSPPEKNLKRENFLLAVSDLYVQKNFKNLISAMANLKADYPGLTLKIAGNPIDEDYFQDLKQMISEERLDGEVELLGGVPPRKLVTLYQRCGIFIFPSTVETFGNPLVEAMACGAPIACSNTASMPEVAGDAAEFFDPSNVESIVVAIECLLENQELRQDLSRKALERAKAFSWPRTAEKTSAVIKEAVVLGKQQAKANRTSGLH